MDVETEIRLLTKDGQTERAVNCVLNKIDAENRDNYLSYIATKSMELRFFTGARRAMSHMPEPLKTNSLLEAISIHKTGFWISGEREIFHKAWLETIKMLPIELQEENIFYFIDQIESRYVVSDELIEYLKEAVSLISIETKKKILRRYFIQLRLFVVNYGHSSNNKALFYIAMFEGEVKDRIISFVLRTILTFNQSKSFNHRDDNSIFSEVLSMGKSTDFTDRQMLKLSENNIPKLIQGSNRYSGNEMVIKLSKFMPKEIGENFISYVSCIKYGLQNYKGKELRRHLKRFMAKEDINVYMNYDISLIAEDY